MHTFQIKVLIRFLESSTCFEHHVFIIRKTMCTCNFYGMFSMHLCTNGLPGDEHMMFETFRRHQ